MKILKQNVISLLLNHFSLWKIPLIFYAFLRLKALIMSLDLYWIKYFLELKHTFWGKKTPKLEKKVENVLEQFFDPGKNPTYLQSHFTQSRAGDKRARWKLLKLARKYTVQEKAKICICLFLSSPCTLLWTSKWTKSPCFEETILRHLNRSRWDIIYFMIQRAEKKICLEQVLVLLNYDKWGCQRVNMAGTWLTSCCCAW